MATGTTVFSRVTVVAPRTRIDVALPAGVAVADLLPMLLEMAKETTPDGGARHGGWCLAKLGDAPLDPSRTLASLGVVDGELLQLRRRTENPPPPLYDDVVDAIAEASPDSYRPWTKQTARRIGLRRGRARADLRRARRVHDRPAVRRLRRRRGDHRGRVGHRRGHARRGHRPRLPGRRPPAC